MQVTWFSMGKAGQWRKRSARRSTDVTLPARHITGSVSVSHRYTPISCVAQTKHSYLTPSRCSDSLNFHLFSSAQTLARLFFFSLFFSFHGAIHSSESLPASTVKTFSFSRAATTLKLYSETYASHTAHSLVY